ncbi:Methyltransferase domain protein [Tsuneonella dongtanensis]|uniref:Methyltransferase domain protein n=1 Tax=Tsuneonella dongtanensis TaxID=692370 RepID=A0A1B2AB92_9SPHN|nr:methyltransferase domain-containing protein [Tsuneonella dongtanensis]ANY19416.1 Methyltransferase domain protein [Tsuneonella dongtanensis]
MSEPSPTFVRRKESRLFQAMQQRFRSRRFALVESMIERMLSERAEVRVLDVGGRARYWHLLRHDLRNRVHITILNFDEELAFQAAHAVAELHCEQATGDGCSMPQYGDGEFDFVHSNSVIEHVGGYARMQDFAAEIRRVGRAYYVQTPNFWFPIDPHTAFPLLHWMPDPVRLFAFTRFRIGLARKVDFESAGRRIDGTRMIGRGTMKALFPDADHRTERFALLFAKSLIATRETR